MYFVYLLECQDGTYYIGTTNDVAKRVVAHNCGKTGAKYTKSRRPVKLRYVESLPDKGSALKREYELKQWSRQKKASLFDSNLTAVINPSPTIAMDQIHK